LFPSKLNRGGGLIASAPLNYPIMSAKLTIVTRDNEVILTSDNYGEAVELYKACNDVGLVRLFILSEPDREKRNKPQAATPAAKRKKTD